MHYSVFFEKAQKASAVLSSLPDKMANEILFSIGEKILEGTDKILSENQKDLDRMSPTDYRYDRLKLTPERIEGIVADLKNVTELPSPVGRILKETTRPNGMKITKISVPFGLIGIIYEARPNVSLDVFSLCFKSGNVCILKGGSDAEFSNAAIVKIIQEVLASHHVPVECCTLLPSEREATAALLQAEGIVDLIIPRGSQSLIDFVRKNTKIPVIETGAGICHTYFDIDGNKEIGQAIVNNAKTRRVSVCNALDCLIIHEERSADLPFICGKLPESQVIIYADEKAYQALSGQYPADLLQPAAEFSFGTEFLDYKMSIKTVANLEEALEHIARYSSKHSECIISENPTTAIVFQKRVDAACVYENVSTAFTDGAQFGLGAEIGISTQKLHARGPMALEELTSYKWIIKGTGQIRNS
ncbi:gamma-glutamyl phosphate reductase [Bacteroidia bacterium]|nr:gamma-glutamyl phosphate reductase [Bacteroidia bacterium]GHV71042.1 gamma-glutamyl phosphate reductase [Bacteroidia bacterium]